MIRAFKAIVAAIILVLSLGVPAVAGPFEDAGAARDLTTQPPCGFIVRWPTKETATHSSASEPCMRKAKA